MDVVAVFVKKASRDLHLRHFPLTLKEFLSHPGDYEFMSWYRRITHAPIVSLSNSHIIQTWTRLLSPTPIGHDTCGGSLAGSARWREEYPVATDEKKEPIRRTGFVHRFPFSRLSLDPADSFCLRASRSLLRNCMRRRQKALPQCRVRLSSSSLLLIAGIGRRVFRFNVSATTELSMKWRLGGDRGRSVRPNFSSKAAM